MAATTTIRDISAAACSGRRDDAASGMHAGRAARSTPATQQPFTLFQQGS
jgi:hypothetical protein